MCFRVKNDNEFKDYHDIMYRGKCSGNDCNDDYQKETTWRKSKRVLDHTSRDMHLYVLKDYIECEHVALDIRIVKSLSKSKKQCYNTTNCCNTSN